MSKVMCGLEVDLDGICIHQALVPLSVFSLLYFLLSLSLSLSLSHIHSFSFSPAASAGRCAGVADLDAAKGKRLAEVVDAEIVHVAHAGGQRVRNALGARVVGGEDRGTEAVVTLVDHGNGILVRLELHDHHHRAKHLPAKGEKKREKKKRKDNRMNGAA